MSLSGGFARRVPVAVSVLAGSFVALAGYLFLAAADPRTVEAASAFTTLGTGSCLIFGLVFVSRITPGLDRLAWVLVAASTIVWLVAYTIDPIEPDVATSGVSFAFWLAPAMTVVHAIAFAVFARDVIGRVRLPTVVFDSLWLGLAALLIMWNLVGGPVLDSGDVSTVGQVAFVTGAAASAFLIGWTATIVPLADRRGRLVLARLASVPIVLAVGQSVFAHDHVTGQLSYGSIGDFLLLSVFAVAAIGTVTRPLSTGVTRRLEAPAARSVGITIAPIVAFAAVVLFTDTEIMTVRSPLGAIVATVGVARLAHLTHEVRRLAHDLHKRATHDGLTGLRNRLGLQEVMDQHGDRPARLLLIDLDRFKAVNDTLGDAAGDELLILVARRIATAAGDGWSVYRMAGDEFAALCVDDGDLDATVAAGKRVIERLSMPFHLDGREAWIGASIGAAATDDQLHPSELRDVAELALRTTQENGRGQVVTADEDVRRRARDRGTLEVALRHAVDRRELFSLYQPKVDITTGAMVGMEALVRWNRPGHGVVPPGEFIAVAEASGLIARVDSWVLADGVANLRRWNEMRGNRKRLKLSTNMSAWQLSRIDVDDEVARAIAWEGGVDPAQVTIELTETLLVDDPEVVARRLRRLTDTGVGVSVDDFGAGFTSVAYLRKFPISEVKIDRALVWELTGGPDDDESLAAAVIALARAMNLEVVAEGVETQEQAAALRRLGCRVAQGFLFAKPLPVEEIDELIVADRPFAQFVEGPGIEDSEPVQT